MNPAEIKERNAHMAHFLGWWQEYPNESSYAWWRASGASITPVTEELTFHKDWNQLMLAVQAITQLPSVSEKPPKGKSKYILLDEIRIGRFGIYLTAYKDSVAKQPAERISFLYSYHASEPRMSNADSYVQAVWLGISDFCKEYNDYTGEERNRLSMPKKRPV